MPSCAESRYPIYHSGHEIRARSADDRQRHVIDTNRRTDRAVRVAKAGHGVADDRNRRRARRRVFVRSKQALRPTVAMRSVLKYGGETISPSSLLWKTSVVWCWVLVLSAGCWCRVPGAWRGAGCCVLGAGCWCRMSGARCRVLSARSAGGIWIVMLVSVTDAIDSNDVVAASSSAIPGRDQRRRWRPSRAVVFVTETTGESIGTLERHRPPEVASTTLNIVVVAPMPSASATMARISRAAHPGERSDRKSSVLQESFHARQDETQNSGC